MFLFHLDELNFSRELTLSNARLSSPQLFPCLHSKQYPSFHSYDDASLILTQPSQSLLCYILVYSVTNIYKIPKLRCKEISVSDILPGHSPRGAGDARNPSPFPFFPTYIISALDTHKFNRQSTDSSSMKSTFYI